MKITRPFMQNKHKQSYRADGKAACCPIFTPESPKTCRKTMGKHEDRMGLFVLFLKGIRFSLSLGENPIEEYARKYRSKSDAENIAQDWRNVGNDIRTAYGKARSEERGTR